MGLEKIETATEAVLRVVREAVRLGLPIYAERKSVGLLRIESRRDSDDYMVFTLLNPLGDEEPVALGKPWDYVVVAVLRGCEVVEERVDQLPYALATNPRVMPDYEADTWSLRIREYRLMEPCGEEDGARRLCSPSNPCVEALVDEYGVVAWRDRCTGEEVDARPWQRRLGLRP